MIWGNKMQIYKKIGYLFGFIEYCGEEAAKFPYIILKSMRSLLKLVIRCLWLVNYWIDYYLKSFTEIRKFDIEMVNMWQDVESETGVEISKDLVRRKSVFECIVETFKDNHRADLDVSSKRLLKSLDSKYAQETGIHRNTFELIMADKKIHSQKYFKTEFWSIFGFK